MLAEFWYRCAIIAGLIPTVIHARRCDNLPALPDGSSAQKRSRDDARASGTRPAISAIAAVTGLACSIAQPAHANQYTNDESGAGFAESVNIMRSAAHSQPTFTTRVECDNKRQCAKVEFAVRSDNNGRPDGADFFIFPDANPRDVHWCYAEEKHPQVRFCQKAGPRPHTEVSWFEASFPKAGEYREIEYGAGHMDPACTRFQTSQYDIDGAYVDCIVSRDDAYPPPPTGGNPSEQGSRASPPVVDLPQSKFAESNYLKIVFGMIKSHLHETPGLHVDLANQHGVVDFYLDPLGNLVGRKLVASSGSSDLDIAVMAAIAEAAPYPVPPNASPVSLNYNFGRTPKPHDGIP
jgi:hypothetical protein